MKPFITNSVFLKYKVVQQDNNACSSIALAQIIYIEMEKQNLNSFFPSILFMYYNARINKNVDEGVFIENLLSSTMEYGIVPDTMWEYYKENPLQEPSPECYEFGKQFPIVIDSIKYDSSENYQDFIRKQLLNDKIILCDIKYPGTNMDHTILILGMDEKNYISLDSLKINSLEYIPISTLNLQLDKKDIYAISCSFQNKCLSQMIQKDYEFELYENIFETFINQCSSIYYDHVLFGGNVSSYYLAKKIQEKNKNESILIIQNNCDNLHTNYQNSPIYSKTFNSLIETENIELFEIINPIYEKNKETIINYFLEPLGLSLTTPNLYYQLILCNKEEKLKNVSFLFVFEGKPNAKVYIEEIENDFPGIDLSLPYYVIMKIVLFYYNSEFLNYTSKWNFMESMELGTFLEKQTPQYANLNVEGYLDLSKLSIVMKKNIQYSDSINISYHQFYNTMNNDTNFISFPNTSLVPFYKMFVYVKGTECKCENVFLGKGFVLKDSIQYMLFEKNIKILQKEKPNYIKNDIYYPITMWPFFQNLFPNKTDIEIMISNVSYFYLWNESYEKDNEIILKNFQKNGNIHYINTNLFGNPYIMENQFNIVNIFQKDD